MILKLPIILLAMIITRMTSACDDNLPEVDLASPDAGINLVDALQNWGFSYLKGHGVDKALIEKAQFQAKRFFGIPNRVKRQVQADRFANVMKTIRGYQGIRNEQLDIRGKPDLKEVLDVGYVNGTSSNRRRYKRHYLGENKWPKDEKDLENVINEYSENVANLAKKVLNLVADGVGANGAFDDTFGDDALQVQRLTRYPPSNEIDDKENGEIGSGTHSDYGGVTILYADGPGLQVLKPNISSTLVICLLYQNANY